MARVEKGELMTRISARLGTTDEDLALITDISDSVDPVDFSEKDKQIEELTAKNEELRAMYKARFTEPAAPVPENNDPDIVDPAEGATEEPLSVEDIAEKLKI